MLRIYTIGHGSRSFDEFAALLQAARIESLIDVRAFPLSRRHPHFSQAQLQPALAARGIGYVWEGKAFGGFRKPAPDSINVAIKQAAFRGFADHMRTPEFRAACGELQRRAAEQRVALMCAERLPSQCHRALIADFLTLQGAQIVHLLDGAQQTHRLHDSARKGDDELVYDLVHGSDLLPF